MVKSEQNSEHKSTYKKQDSVERDSAAQDRYKSPSRTSQTITDKMTVMLSFRTLKEITQKLETYKQPNYTPLTTPTRLADHYERTSKLLTSLNLDSQIINQSSLAIKSTLEASNNLFSSS